MHEPATATPDSWNLLPPGFGDGAGPSLDPTLVGEARAIESWLLSEAVRLDKAEAALMGLAERLNAVSIPVDRITTAIEVLHSDYAGIGRFWSREEGATVRLFPHGSRGELIYRRSPFAYVHATRRWLQLDLDRTPDDLFNIVPDLKQAGYRHYLCIPISFTNGAENGISFATRAAEGFGSRGIGILRAVMPALAAVLEVRALNKRLEEVLRIYVGDEPHRAILSGTIRRGEVSRIRSAILFADMRDYARISFGLKPEETVELLNAYFDCIVPPIEESGGEVLKYLGDGLLAIFRDPGNGGAAAAATVAAANRALAEVESGNRDGRFPAPVALGVALHHGEAAYGNVGAGGRLDFTVIGRDVNLASRIAELNKTLREPLLMSKAFAEHLEARVEPLGSHPVDGFDEPVQVYRLPR